MWLAGQPCAWDDGDNPRRGQSQERSGYGGRQHDPRNPHGCLGLRRRGRRGPNWPGRPDTQRRSGCDNTGRDNTGRDNTGRDNTGRDNAGYDNTGRKNSVGCGGEAVGYGGAGFEARDR
ncbi:hypothetical protein [Bifidobacterium sp. UTBIF-78]|uniref:hypothetical protein n=1 Tax=Bifidobacterium sp. UTBIF-78 TaxID=1465263 RepID=UPI00112746C2